MGITPFLYTRFCFTPHVSHMTQWETVFAGFPKDDEILQDIRSKGYEPPGFKLSIRFDDRSTGGVIVAAPLESGRDVSIQPEVIGEFSIDSVQSHELPSTPGP